MTAHREIDAMARGAVADAAEQLRARARALANASPGRYRVACRRAAQAMYKAASLLDETDESWETE